MHIQYSTMNGNGQRCSDTSEEILRAAGAEVISTGGKLTAPGRIIHDWARLAWATILRHRWSTNSTNGMTSKTYSSQMERGFVSSANQNPTLTILALTLRACEYLTDEI